MFTQSVSLHSIIFIEFVFLIMFNKSVKHATIVVALYKATRFSIRLRFLKTFFFSREIALLALLALCTVK